MRRTLWNLLLTLPIFLVLLLLAASAKVSGQEIPSESHPDVRVAELLESFDTGKQDLKLEQNNQLITQSPETTPIEPVEPSSESSETTPVTSVSQLSDVQPTDWAFQALQSLIERYNCLLGSSSTYRGNRALRRYEFAAGLNACLEQVNKLIASSTANLATNEDLTTVQRLTEEFRPELVELAGRLDSLETRTTQVEADRFSTTTKLIGNALFLVADAFGDLANSTPGQESRDTNNTVFAYLTRLSFQTSFTGKDLLVTTLRADNIPNLTASTGTSMTRFALDGATFGNNGYLENLYYRFPIGKKATVWVGPRALNFAVYVPTLNSLTGNPFQGGFSRFGQFNPTVYRPGFDGAGGSFGYRFSDQLQAHVAYISDGDLAASRPDVGLFKGSFAAIAQLTFTPSRQLDIGLTYTRKYFTANSGLNLTGGTGGAFARNPFGQNATSSDNFGLEFNWKVSQRFNLSGWVGYTQAHQETGGDNDATIINGLLAFGFPDLFQKGNLGGINVGIPPKVTSNNFTLAGQRREDQDTSLHFETFYSFRVNNNIRVTPILFVITSPEHNDNPEENVRGCGD